MKWQMNASYRAIHGRGGRLGRDRGVGRDLGLALGGGVGLALGDGVAVGLGDGVALGVGVGVGTAARSNEGINFVVASYINASPGYNACRVIIVCCLPSSHLDRHRHKSRHRYPRRNRVTR